MSDRDGYLQYLENVLGIRSFLAQVGASSMAANAAPAGLDIGQIQDEQDFRDIQATPTVRLRVFLAENEVPLGEPSYLSAAQEDLLHKMLQAMKLTEDAAQLIPLSSDVAFGDFMESFLEDSICVCFGEKAWRALQATDPKLGDFTSAFGHWQNWRGYAVMPTHSLQEMLEQPHLKKSVWHHLQDVMKRI